MKLKILPWEFASVVSYHSKWNCPAYSCPKQPPNLMLNIWSSLSIPVLGNIWLRLKTTFCCHDRKGHYCLLVSRARNAAKHPPADIKLARANVKSANTGKSWAKLSGHEKELDEKKAIDAQSITKWMPFNPPCPNPEVTGDLNLVD